MGDTTIQMLHGTPLTSGSTFEEYVQSVKDNGVEEFWKHYNVNSALVRYQIEKIGYVPGFLEYFHHSEFYLQKRILYMLSNEKCVWSSFMYLKMIHDTGSDWTVVKEWKEDPHQQFGLGYCDGQDGRPSKKFSNVASNLLWRIASVHNLDPEYRRFPTIDAQTITLLAIKHGEKKVTEIINECLSSTQGFSLNFYNFTQLIENWDSVKGYPVEWALNVIGAHQCRNSDDEK